MIIDSFDDKTPPISTTETFYGEKRHLTDVCLVFFSEKILKRVLSEFECEEIAAIFTANGKTPIYKLRHNGRDIAFYMSAIGSCMAVEYLAVANHVTGATKFVMFGSAGSLDKSLTYGKIVLPSEAYRDEGTSYHYAPPSDYIKIENCDKLGEILDALAVSYVKGRVWTTDSFIMETVGKTAKRRADGCIAVEMELAGVQAACSFYGLELYDFLVTGDVLLEDGYDPSGLEYANHDAGKLFLALKIAELI